MSKISGWHIVAINREEYHDPKNTLKIDNKLIQGVQEVKIEYGLSTSHPIVTIKIAVNKITAKVKSKNIAVVDGE
jgi:hypothetical protein